MYILSRTVSKLLQIIGQICAFEAPYGGLGAGYDVDHRLIGKPVVDFLLVISELFFASSYACGATSEYRLESAVLEGGGSRQIQNFRYKGTSPTNHLCTDR